jgi:signal transduction histidine kinase
LTQLLKDDPTLDDEQVNCLNLIGGASVESLELIDAIMQIDNHNRQGIDRQIHDINKIIQNCVNQLKAPAAGKNQSIIVQLPPEQQMALVDIEKMQRVIKNLLINAIKFSHKGGTIHVSVKHKENNIIIKIKDEGIGIPEHLQHKIFDTFTEAKRPGTENEKTFGLGLSICKQFIEAHGGKIWFSSTENQGSTFYIKLHGENTIQTVTDYQEAWSS